jgi:SAM-dependent methyltransferase
MILLYLFLLVFIIYVIFFISQFNNVLLKGYPPFISTDSVTSKKIISEVQTKDGMTVYELGCGRARFLRLAEKAWPRAKLIGVENLFTLYFLNKIRLKLQGSKIKLVNDDIFKVNLADADLIYCYLSGGLMEKLQEKFKRECRPGTQIVSRCFSIDQMPPEKVMTIRNKTIYFYKIWQKIV